MGLTRVQELIWSVVMCIRLPQRDMWDNSSSWWSSVLGWCKYERAGKNDFYCVLYT